MAGQGPSGASEKTQLENYKPQAVGIFIIVAFNSVRVSEGREEIVEIAASVVDANTLRMRTESIFREYVKPRTKFPVA